MAHKIIIDGEIGWEVTAETVRNQIKEAKGQDLDIELSSGGGSVFEGITIYNLIKNYEGNTSITISGLAASMGSYIALAGDSLAVSENSVYMIHNAWGFSGGDHKELKKTANLLESLSGLLNKAYVAKTGKSSEEITNLMDEESWFFGSEIVEAGFADSVIQAEVKEDREEAVLAAMLRVEACNTKSKAEDKKEDLSKAAALFKQPKAQVAVIKKQQEETMTPEEIEAKVAEAFAKGAESVKVAEEPAAKEEVSVSDMAMDILASASYPDSVKAVAKKVLKGEQTQENLEALVAMADLLTEKAKVEAAAKETKETGETPHTEEEVDVVNGRAVTAKGVSKIAAAAKEQRTQEQGASK